jgi:Tfp pilus assembly protein PilF
VPAVARLVPVAGGTIVIVCAVMAHAQVLTWRDSATLWRNALDVAPKNCRAHVGLADALMEAGRSDEAIDHYVEAVRLAPRAASIHNSFGLALTQSGHIDEAAACMYALQHEVLASQKIPVQGVGREAYRS